MTRGASIALLVAVLAAVAAAPPPRPDPEAAWAAGYAAFVRRFCPGFDVDAERESRAGALPFGDDAPEWGEDGSARLAFRTGAGAAERGFKADAAFCRDPAPVAGDRAPLVRAFLVPPDGPAGRSSTP